MLGVLHPDEIEDMLFRHHVGQIACVVNGKPYIVPITYQYEQGAIYGHTVAGTKASAMRQNPVVGFAIQDHPEPRLWRSVVAEGAYEELTGAESRATVREMLDLVSPQVHMDGEEIVFRIRMTGRSGRWLRTEHPD
jgi:nitroimidazol reductase NimA-like FMN-containing flavoprotein (pyridoxamine 5'-phosphate oxidase superfamily)